MTKTQYIKDINMMNDALLKSLFRSIEAREMIASFLSAVTGISEESLMKAEYVGGEIPKRRLYEKGKTSDIIVMIDKNSRIIIEINQYKTDYLFEKNTEYAFSNILELTKVNQTLYPKVILISLDAINSFKTKSPILSFKIRDEENHIENELYTSIHLILANIVNYKYNISEEVRKFAKLLKSTDLEEMKDNFKGDEVYMSGIKKVEELVCSPEFAGLYDIEERRQRDILDSKLTGLREGKEEGIQESKIEIAKTMLEKNMEINLISELTGLSVDQIQELAKKEI